MVRRLGQEDWGKKIGRRYLLTTHFLTFPIGFLELIRFLCSFAPLREKSVATADWLLLGILPQTLERFPALQFAGCKVKSSA
jgi:hypothetical protein